MTAAELEQAQREWVMVLRKWARITNPWHIAQWADKWAPRLLEHARLADWTATAPRVSPERLAGLEAQASESTRYPWRYVAALIADLHDCRHELEAARERAEGKGST